MSAPRYTKAEAGALGARRRWGPDGRLIRLSNLDPVTREVVLTIIRARRNAAEAAARDPGQG
jgi:hypothetical protein